MDISVMSWALPTVAGISLLFCASLFEFLWKKRVLFGEVATALCFVGGLFLLAAPLSLLSKVLLLVLQTWFTVLAIRLFFGRLDQAFLRTSTRFNSTVSLAVIGFVILLWSILFSQETWVVYWWTAACFGIIALSMAIILFSQTLWTLEHYRVRKIHKTTLNFMPTVTLAIPARNETHALTECLSAAVASDYPKLEILVLDDCSQDKTSALIRSFAHDGVRFIQGKQPAEGWLGKNRAFEVLADQANGNYILFIGVDTQLEPQSISQLIDYALSHKLAMVSVLPQRRDGLSWATLLWQLRYFWQIALPITRRRLPVASQSWLIRSDVLRSLGGFSAIKQKILPESFFARRLFDGERYRFIVSDAALGITTAKKWSSQNESAIRFLYPTFKRQPLFIFLGCLGIALFLLQLTLLVLIKPLDFLWWLAILSSFLLLLSYGLVVVRTVPRVWLGALIFFPLTLVQEFVLLPLSMLLYEFGEVNWKGRNICYPVIAPSSSKRPF